MNFVDVKKEHWAYEAINHGVDKGYIVGYEDKTFKPNNGLTRAEFCTIIARRHPKFDKKKKYYSKFLDCTGEEWFTPYISFCYQKGCINTYEVKNEEYAEFKPNQLITREETAFAFANIIEEV